ncbi:hypothetical protein NQ317_017764 [Molorchus minor]|uniref:CHK kinase-like domain-containing protein n=1 Tax=Molorchus minor TaxID=1323400 RepID=A0ABQ9JIA9_9CUCU|nr:hypothetical protein NQ317_017764 [Molorchus minor]
MTIEKLVFENLRYKNFQTMEKKSTFDKQHVEFVFKQYGKLHAISFAYRELKPNEYLQLANGLKSLYKTFSEIASFRDSIKKVFSVCLENLEKEGNNKIVEKFKRYVENGPYILSDVTNYKGKYSAILHGDCWSNNMMFKYDETGALEDMRMIDFQLSYVGSPVTDLSYCLYSSGSKELFDQLDHFLSVYHRSLIEAVKQLGCYSENIFPLGRTEKGLEGVL